MILKPTPRSPISFPLLLLAALLWTGCDSGGGDPVGELIIQDLVAGTGNAVEPGHGVMVSYEGMLEDGTSFDGSAGRALPFAFTVGVGQVIEGFDEGMLGMQEGGKRRLIIPPHKAFGKNGVADRNVPGNATVTYEITLDRLLENVYIEDLVEGSGEVAGNGSVVTVDYVGLLNNGDVFDATNISGEPYTFTLGAGQVIEGWERGLQGMKVGGKRLLVIPTHLAYGQFGFGSAIPPYAVLTFQIDLVAVN